MSYIRGENDTRRPGDRYIKREPQVTQGNQYNEGQGNQQEGIYKGIYFGEAAPCGYIKTSEEPESNETRRTR